MSWKRGVLGGATLVALALVLTCVLCLVRERQRERERIRRTHRLIERLDALLRDLAQAAPLPHSEAGDVNGQRALANALAGISIMRRDSAPLVQVIGVSGFHPLDPLIFEALDLNGPVKDGWGRAIRYCCPARDRAFLVYSIGPNDEDDGGGGDDIANVVSDR